MMDRGSVERGAQRCHQSVRARVGTIPAHGTPRYAGAPRTAGMVPRRGPRVRPGRCAPRTRRDGPAAIIYVERNYGCSPHPRGCSHVPAGPAQDEEALPSPAGMVPRRRTRRGSSAGVSRTCGDGSGLRLARGGAGGGESDGRSVRVGERGVIPAPAGMVPSGVFTIGTSRGAPRTRGDSPTAPPVRGPPAPSIRTLGSPARQSRLFGLRCPARGVVVSVVCGLSAIGPRLPRA